MKVMAGSRNSDVLNRGERWIRFSIPEFYAFAPVAAPLGSGWLFEIPQKAVGPVGGRA
jgi:hypothetical protein